MAITLASCRRDHRGRGEEELQWADITIHHSRFTIHGSLSPVHLGIDLRARNKMTGPVLLPSFSRRGGCEADGVVTWAPLAPTTPPANPSPPPLSRAERGGSRFLSLAWGKGMGWGLAGTPPPAGGEFNWFRALIGVHRRLNLGGSLRPTPQRAFRGPA